MDRYDQEIERLSTGTGSIERIRQSWALAEPLFSYCGHPDNLRDVKVIGCLTQIRGGFVYKAQTPELTKQIRADVRIPMDANYITVEHLPVFAEWQRRLDKELNRDPPALLEAV